MTNDRVRLPTARQFLAPYDAVRGHRSLALLLLVHLVTRLAHWLYLISILVLAYQISHSPAIVAALTLVRLLPNALILPFAGALTDRGDRKLMMMASTFVRGLSVLGLIAVHDGHTLLLAYPLLLVATVFSALFRPAMMAALPDMVGDRRLLQANSVMTQIEMACQGLGPTIGGVLILVGDIRLTFLASGMVFLVATILLWRVRIPSPENDPDIHRSMDSMLPNISAGFRFLAKEHDRVLLAFALALSGTGLLSGANLTLTVVLSERAFSFGSQGASFLNGAYGVGAVIGGSIVAFAVAQRAIGVLFIASAAGSSIFAIAYGFSGSFLPFALIACVGIADIFTRVSALTVIQVGTPRALLGRVFSAFESALLMSQLIGAISIGALIEVVGPRRANAVLAIVGLVLLALVSGRVLALRGALSRRLFLRQVPAFDPIETSLLDDLAERLSISHQVAGATIVREGDTGEMFYIIQRGEVRVSARGQGERRITLATLRDMDFFGEIALLRDVPRTATVTAVGAVELYCLHRNDFQYLLKHSPDFETSLDKLTTARHLDLQAQILFTP